MVAVFIVLLFLLPIVVSLKFLPHDRLIFKYKLGKNAQLKSSIATLEDILPVVSPYLVCGMASLGAKITLDYFANQKIVAELINGIPQRSQILEVEASDPKHIFYLPYPCEYTAHLQSKPNSDKDRKSFLDIFQLVSRYG